MAEPWGQCGGISSCPETLEGQCLDQAWPTVCCPPANNFQQVRFEGRRQLVCFQNDEKK